MEATFTSGEDEVMWVEKYRPKTLDEVTNHKDTIQSLNAFLATPKTMPHLLFAGPAGTGKTSVALCIAQKLLEKHWRDYTLELNASDERGINMIRERVKAFSRHATGTLGNIPFNLIILDECDQMTADAQTALRRIMETNSRVSRFILICNFSSKIIAPIQSRCVIFRFAGLKKEDIVGCLQRISKKEALTLKDDGASGIVEYCGGDLRRAINVLQAASTLSKTVDEKVVLQVVGQASPKEVGEMLKKAFAGNYLEARDMLYDLMTRRGLSATDIIRQIHREVLKLDFPENDRAELSNIIGEYDFRLVEGANEDIQLSALLAQFAKYNADRGKKA